MTKTYCFRARRVHDTPRLGALVAVVRGRGYRASRPPGRAGTARRRICAPPSRSANSACLSLEAVVERIAAEVAALDQKPILIGHSIGGLVARILLGRGAAAAGVAMHSTPSGQVLPISRTYWLSNWGMIGPFVDAGRRRR